MSVSAVPETALQAPEPNLARTVTAPHPPRNRDFAFPDGPLLRTVTAPSPPRDRDFFAFPDGHTWSVPASWKCREKAEQWRRHSASKMQSYTSLRQDGESWLDEFDKQQVYHLSSACKVVDFPLRFVAKPRRARPRSANCSGCSLERDRLERVMDAMIAGKPLPPVLLEVAPGAPAKVANGFHRYFASLILGFTELPVEVPSVMAGCPATQPVVPKAKWVPPSVRRRMEAQQSAEKKTRCSQEGACADRCGLGAEVDKQELTEVEGVERLGQTGDDLLRTVAVQGSEGLAKAMQ